MAGGALVAAGSVESTEILKRLWPDNIAHSRTTLIEDKGPLGTRLSENETTLFENRLHRLETTMIENDDAGRSCTANKVL